MDNFDIIKFEESYIEEVVHMWRTSKELAFGQEDIHDLNEDMNYILHVLCKENCFYLAIEKNTKKVIGMLAVAGSNLNQLYVHVDYLRMRVGTSLLNLAKEISPGVLELFLPFNIIKEPKSFMKRMDSLRLAETLKMN